MHPEFWRVLLTLFRPLLVALGSPLAVIAGLALVRVCGEEPLGWGLTRLLDRTLFVGLVLTPGLAVGASGCPAGSQRLPWLAAAFAPLAMGPALVIGISVLDFGGGALTPGAGAQLAALVELTPIGYLPGILTAAIPSLCLVLARREKVRFVALAALSYAAGAGALISGLDISGDCTPLYPSLLVATIYGAAASGLILGPIAADRALDRIEASLAESLETAGV